MPKSLEELASALNADMQAFYLQRCETMGLDASGLYAHYKNVLDHYKIVGPGVVALAKFVLEELPSFRHYVILRAGLGELGFLLARAGKAVTLVDIFTSRVAATEAFAAHQVEHGHLTAQAVSVHGGIFPPYDVEASDTLGIAAHFLNVAKIGEEANTARAMRRFTNLVIEERTFLNMRETPEARRDGVGLLINSGFRERKKSQQGQWNWLERVDPVAQVRRVVPYKDLRAKR